MPTDVPQNAGYMIAAYVVVTALLGGYAVSLWRRARAALHTVESGRSTGVEVRM